jgi:hypothetical protein
VRKVLLLQLGLRHLPDIFSRAVLAGPAALEELPRRCLRLATRSVIPSREPCPRRPSGRHQGSDGSSTTTESSIKVGEGKCEESLF